MYKSNKFTDIGYIILFGVVTGILTSFGQTVIPDPFRQLANSYSIWLLMSFVAAILMHRYRYAIIGGALIQYLAIAFYYVVSIIRFDTGFSISSNLIWFLGGTLAGPLVGYLGLYLKNDQRYKFLAPSFIAGLFYSESAYEFINLKYIPEGFVFLIFGTLILGWLLYKYRPDFLKTIAATFALSILMYIAYGVLLVSIFS